MSWVSRVRIFLCYWIMRGRGFSSFIINYDGQKSLCLNACKKEKCICNSFVSDAFFPKWPAKKDMNYWFKPTIAYLSESLCHCHCDFCLNTYMWEISLMFLLSRVVVSSCTSAWALNYNGYFIGVIVVEKLALFFLGPCIYNAVL